MTLRFFSCTCALWLLTSVGSAQLKTLDASKLPPSADVQQAYQKALEVERYSQRWSNSWAYSVPKTDVAKTLTASFNVLRKASDAAPENHELRLAAGLVAHFAYNLNVESAFQPAVDFLSKALKEEPDDVRGTWFLGIHECQALEVVSGMNRLLAVEASGRKLPIDFWNDYMACANVAILPAHALRAIDHAVVQGRPREEYDGVRDIAESRYKTADLTKVVDEHDAWVSDDEKDNRVRFTSRLCGVSFVANWSWGLQVAKVADRTCNVGLTPPAKKGQASPTILVTARMTKDGETLESFTRGLLENPSSGVTSLTSFSCPVERCVGLDLQDKNLYSKNGGAHVLVMAFERELPRYDGLGFETPQGPPTTKPTNTPVVFHFDPQFRRMPGKIYYAVLLDANVEIFDGSKPDWDAVVKSLQVE